MPRRQTPTSKRQNRSYRRRGKSRALGTGERADNAVSYAGSIPSIVARSLPLFGYSKRVNLNYYTAGTLGTGAGSAGSYTFSCNGLFDPDITSVGGQPAGFDQMMVFFEHYTVKRARIQVTFSNISTANQLMFAVYVSPDASPVTNYERLVENGTLIGTLAAVAGVDGCIVKLNKSVSIAKLLGIRDLMTSSIARGDSASNPSEQCYFQLVCWNPFSVAISSNNNFQILISYDAVFTERRETIVSSSFLSRCGNLLPPIRESLRKEQYGRSRRYARGLSDLEEEHSIGRDFMTLQLNEAESCHEEEKKTPPPLQASLGLPSTCNCRNQ